MRIMGLDYGTKTVGVALSDELLITAQPFITIERKKPNKLRQTYAQLESIVAEYGVSEIALGYPKNMNNSLGERALETEEFKKNLERRTGLPVILIDERLTTREADRILAETGVAGSGRKEHIDKMAAAIILQTWLDFRNNEGEEG